MDYYLEVILPWVIHYKYLAIFFALTIAGFGIPIPEEMTIVVGAYLVTTGTLSFGTTLLICYAGVVAGDVITYCLGRFAGRWVMTSRPARFVVSRKQLAQAQYYYRQYGPFFLLGARQLPGLRFPAFFTAGMFEMRFLTFLSFDGLAASISMPIVFFVTYIVGPRLRDALSFVVRIRDFTGIIILGTLGVLALSVFGYILLRRVNASGSNN